LIAIIKPNIEVMIEKSGIGSVRPSVVVSVSPFSLNEVVVFGSEIVDELEIRGSDVGN
jgi:hypothetical protein